MTGVTIKAIIVDMGGVLLRTETQEPRRKLAARLGLSLEELYEVVFESQESKLLQLGEVSYEQAWDTLAQRFGLDQRGLAEVQHQMFEADRLDLELVSYLRRARGTVKTALLSNAGTRLRQTLRENHIEDAFDEVIISAEVGVMKPDPESYWIALNRLGVEPQEAIFVDDFAANVEGACRVGMLGIQFTTTQDLTERLDELLRTARAQAGGSADMPRLEIRSYDPTDLPALAELINTADRVDNAGRAMTERALAEWLNRPSVEPARDLFLACVGRTLVGYVLAERRPETELDRIGAIGIVHPAWRRRGVGEALMVHIEQHALGKKADKPLFLEMVTRESVAGAAELACSLGMRPVRYFSYMQCSDLGKYAEPTLPAGIRFRLLDPSRDVQSFTAAYNDAFSDHWGYSLTTIEEVEHWLHSGNYHPGDITLAVDDDDSIAGFCALLFPQMEPEMLKSNPPMVDDLGVVHRFRRHGLGRALLLAGMRHVHSLGHEVIALEVDDDNPHRAQQLYESVGFSVVSRSTAFRKRL
ncbi:MAG TPA: GNAT family N-acetyltransferase [Anaerolineae bacterium]|nr:GNAT family N-acetyltransferase [Anaerolineae bacterium]